MKIDNEFTVSAPIDHAWAVLTDLEGIAPCMPGALLTGREGETFQGKVKIKVGPVTSEYAGTAAFVEKDDAAHHAVIDAKGRDSRGAGNASALITADLTAEGTATKVTVSTDLKITGKIAQFGSGMIQEVSRKLMGQFVDCLETKLAGPAPALAVAAEPEGVTAPPAPPETDAPAPQKTDAPASQEAGAPASQSAPVAPLAPQPAHEHVALDVLALSRGAILKRLVPLVIGVVVVALLIYVVAR